MVFGRKIKANFEVDFSADASISGQVAFVPGDRVEGQARFVPEEDVTMDEFAIQLVWYTEGRGDQDLTVVESDPGGTGLLTASIPVTQRFSFTLPSYPWSYAGQLINIIWAIRVMADPARGKTFYQSVPFVVSPSKRVLQPPSFEGMPESY